MFYSNNNVLIHSEIIWIGFVTFCLTMHFSLAYTGSPLEGHEFWNSGAHIRFARFNHRSLQHGIIMVFEVQWQARAVLIVWPETDEIGTIFFYFTDHTNFGRKNFHHWNSEKKLFHCKKKKKEIVISQECIIMLYLYVLICVFHQ